MTTTPAFPAGDRAEHGIITRYFATESIEIGERFHAEANLPAKDPPPGARARFPGAHGDKGRPSGAQAAAPARSPAIDTPDECPRQEDQLERLIAPACPDAGLSGGKRPARWMESRYRLRGPHDFKRVRRTGRSYAHPLVVLVASPNGLAFTRLGVAAGKTVGDAVDRNRAKRRMRAALRLVLPAISPGWDLIWIARPALVLAEWKRVQQAFQLLLQRSGLLEGDEGER